MPLNWNLFNVCFMLRMKGLKVSERKSQRENAIVFFKRITTWLLVTYVHLNHLPVVVFLYFPYSHITIFPFSCSILLKKSLCEAKYLQWFQTGGPSSKIIRIFLNGLVFPHTRITLLIQTFIYISIKRNSYFLSGSYS